MLLLLRLRSLSSYVVYRFPRPPRFAPPSPTLPPAVAHTSFRRCPCSPSRHHLHRRPRFPPLSLTLPPIIAHASPYLLPRFPSHQPRFLPPSSSSSHRRPPFSPTSLHVVITPLPITFPLFTIASPPSHPFPSHLGSSLYSFPITTFSTPTIAHGGDEALEQSVGGIARAARASGQQGVQCCRGRVRGAGEAGMRERGCRDPPIPLIPCHTFTSCPPPLLRSVVPPQPSSSPSPFLPSSISLPHYPLYPLCCPSSLPPVLPSSRPPFISSAHHLIPPSSHPPIISSPLHLIPPSSHPPIISSPHHLIPPIISSPHHLIPPSSHPPIISSPHHLIPPSSHPPIITSPHHLIRPSTHPPIISSAHHLIPPSSHPPIFSSPHHLIRPSSHPPIISPPHHLIPPSSHPPIISSPHHLIRPSSHPPIISSAHHLIRPSSVSPLLIFCLRAFFVPHRASEFVVRVYAGLPCIQS
ncbi:unnamed protein product [Closterium sp. NIES-65]|nr:unnamed protein product [Closterium sp. NIES-65]